MQSFIFKNPSKKPTSKNPVSLRIALRVLLFISGLAVLATPASAATSLDHINGGTLAAIIAFGMLLFAIVFDVWRMTLRHTAPARNRATQDWKPTPPRR